MSRDNIGARLGAIRSASAAHMTDEADPETGACEGRCGSTEAQKGRGRSKGVAAPQCQVEQEGEQERQEDAHPTAGHSKSHRH